MKKKHAFLLLAVVLIITAGVIAASGSARPISAEEADCDMPLIDALLLSAGLPYDKLNTVAPEIRKKIARDLSEHADYIGGIIFIPLSEENNGEFLLAPCDYTQPLGGLSYSVLAFSGKLNGAYTAFIYPIFEFAKTIRPRGGDAFFIVFGEGLRPHSFSGSLWFQNPITKDWLDGGSLLPTGIVGLQGMMFSGEQLGNAVMPLQTRGVFSVRARFNPSSTDYRIGLAYLHNPHSAGYTFAVEADMRLSFSPGRRVYVFAEIKNLPPGICGTHSRGEK